jgi:hypothetical protein
MILLRSLPGRAAVAAALFLAAGCAAGSYGSLRRSPEATRSFQAAEVLPGHRYYTTGSRNVPDAILAVADPYTMKAETWREERDITPEQLKILVFGIDEQGQGLTDFPVGMDVLGPGGEKIGVWYSDLYFTTVELLEDNQVMVHSPAKIRAGRVDLRRASDRD